MNIPFISRKRAAQRDQLHVRQGEAHAQAKLRDELTQAVGDRNLLQHAPEKWQRTMGALFADQLSRGALLTPAQSETLLVQLGAAGCSLDESTSLMRWRQEAPELLVTLLLCVLAGMPDSEIWAVAKDF